MLTLIAVVLFSVLAGVPSSTPPQKQGSADDSRKGPALNQPLTVEWRVRIPPVGCDNGAPILNAELPDKNAPSAICPGVRSPDVLPPTTATTDVPENDFEAGTVIVMGVSHEKVVLAADSRNVLITSKKLANGTEAAMKYNDCACKLTQLTPTMLFAADGQVWAGNIMPSAVLYDAHKLARLAARNYRPDAEEERIAGGRIAAVATRWAWDVDFRMHHGFTNGWRPIETLEGIFAGLDENGDVAIAVAKLEYPRRRPGLRVPPVGFTVVTMEPPSRFTWVEAFGMKDVAERYYSLRAVTDRTRPEYERIRAEILKIPALFNPNIPEQLVDFTIRHYEAVAKGPVFVHGPIDVAFIERNRQVAWIHAKDCSGATQRSRQKSIHGSRHCPERARG